MYILKSFQQRLLCTLWSSEAFIYLLIYCYYKRSYKYRIHISSHNDKSGCCDIRRKEGPWVGNTDTDSFQWVSLLFFSFFLSPSPFLFLLFIVTVNYERLSAAFFPSLHLFFLSFLRQEKNYKWRQNFRFFFVFFTLSLFFVKENQRSRTYKWH